jgi:hypothetical protein
MGSRSWRRGESSGALCRKIRRPHAEGTKAEPWPQVPCTPSSQSVFISFALATQVLTISADPRLEVHWVLPYFFRRRKNGVSAVLKKQVP